MSAFGSEVLTWLDCPSLFLLGGAGINTAVAVVIAVTVAIDIGLQFSASPGLAVAVVGPRDWH